MWPGGPSTTPATWPAPRRCSRRRSAPRWPARASASWRSSPCARRGGSWRRRRPPPTSASTSARCTGPGSSRTSWHRERRERRERRDRREQGGAMSGALVVNTGGRYGEVLASSMTQTLPDERVVGARRAEDVPGDAEVLVTLLDAPDGVEALLEAPVPWVHALSAGIDRFPLAAARGKVVSCSRGASSVAIAEWVLAM